VQRGTGIGGQTTMTFSSYLKRLKSKVSVVVGFITLRRSMAQLSRSSSLDTVCNEQGDVFPFSPLTAASTRKRRRRVGTDQETSAMRVSKSRRMKDLNLALSTGEISVRRYRRSVADVAKLAVDIWARSMKLRETGYEDDDATDEEGERAHVPLSAYSSSSSSSSS